ncbi:MAG: phosphatidylserine/phosphatidylglycerophosphate/cardiolipin synthase family protein, partial [Bdellovibrionales bacterium]|nr:phosphatidylserine/phosphatidylglycerophosphate/cardiolipin synthase family protein [Bdellovibrionales bacterium]
MHLILILFITFGAWANPFAPYLIPVKDKGFEANFHPQKPPFIYPFEVSDKLERQNLALKKIATDFPENSLNALEDFYNQFKFDDNFALYAYPFAIRPEWEFLPYSFVPHLDSTTPKQWISNFKIILDENEGVRSLAFQQKLDAVTNSRAYAGNKLKLLKTPASYQEIFKQISQAKEHVFLATFLFQCDSGTAPLVALLEQKVKAGVDIYLIIDRLMSTADPDCKQKLKSIGVKLGLQGGVNHIFHEKMLITDANFAMIDGQNLLGPQLSSDGTNNLINDNAVGVEGPMVAVIAERFIQHWEMQKSRRLPEKLKSRYQKLSQLAEKFAEKDTVASGLKAGSGVCRLVTKGASKKHREILELFLETVKATKNYLFFNNIQPTYKNPEGKLPGEVFLSAVVDQANAHPEMRVDMLSNNWKRATDISMVGSNYDTRNLFSRLVTFMGETLFGQQYIHIPVTRKNLIPRLLNDNFHWWSYGQYMHAKTLMSDNIWTLIGSYNIN